MTIPELVYNVALKIYKVKSPKFNFILSYSIPKYL